MATQHQLYTQWLFASPGDQPAAGSETDNTRHTGTITIVGQTATSLFKWFH